jgi:uncharacterized protein
MQQLPAVLRAARRRAVQPTLVGDATIPIEAVPASRRATLLGTLGFVAVTAAALTWAKWYPYWHKIPAVAGSHKLGTSILTGTAGAPPAPSWRAAIGYTISYGRAIWPALVAGLLIAASVEAFLPAHRLLALFRAKARPVAGTLSGGLLSLPSMMCTCCAAPVAIGIRRRGVPVNSALAYWLGNPVLNPAALVFMAFVLPWQFLTVRLLTGLVLVFGVTLLVGRLAGAGRTVTDPAVQPDQPVARAAGAESRVDGAGRRFVTALGRLSIRLLPEYLVVLFAVVGTLFVIPTAGEIPIIQGLLAASVGAGPVGALVLTLPALSLPSMLMVRRAFPARVIVATGLAVAALGMAGAGLLMVLT